MYDKEIRSFRPQVFSSSRRFANTGKVYITTFLKTKLALSVRESSVCWKINLSVSKSGMWAQRVQFIINNCLFSGKSC